MSYLILLVANLTLIATLTSRRNTRMQLDDLKNKLQELADEVTALQGQVLLLTKSVTTEIQRVEDVIAQLKQGLVDPKDLEPLTAQLQTAVDNLKATQSTLATAQQQLDAEQAAPAASVGA